VIAPPAETLRLGFDEVVVKTTALASWVAGPIGR